MEQRKACYFCTSPFQFFSILSLAFSRDETADLYIDPQFSDAEEYAVRLKKTGLFNDVKVIAHDSIMSKYFTARRGLINHLQIANSYFHVRKLSEDILGRDVHYEKIFVSSKAYLPRLVILNQLRRKEPFSVSFIDDGVGSYCQDRAYKPRWSDRMMRALLFGKEANNTSKERFLFAPEVFLEQNSSCKNMVREIPKYWEIPNGLDTINYLFGVTANHGIDEKTIILDEPLEEIISDDNANKIEAIYERAESIVGKENVICKMHPRSNKIRAQKHNCYRYGSVPFEVLCMNSDYSDRLLISFASTAVVTPKLFFEAEPFVVLLYKLSYPDTVSDQVDPFFQAIKRKYKDRDRFVIPETDNEAIDAIRQYEKESN